MRRFVFLLLIWVALCGLHPVYVSITQINIKPTGLQITIRAFAEDVVEAMHKARLRADDTGYERYVLSKISITLGNELQTLRYIGKEQEADVVYFYLELNQPNEGEMIVSQEILHEVFDEQTNIVHFQKNGNIKTGICTRDQSTTHFNK